MKIKAIEPTPSPHTMKIILDEELPAGKRNNYRNENIQDAPSSIQKILQLDGVKGVYHVADFIAVERHPKADWKELLRNVRIALGEDEERINAQEKSANDSFGEVKVEIQMFKNIPLQVKLTDSENEKRFGLPDPFLKAFEKVQQPGDNFVLDRKWVDWGVRYGELEDIGNTVVEEITAAYPEVRLNELVEQVLNPNAVKTSKRFRKVTLKDLEHPDWKKDSKL